MQILRRDAFEMASIWPEGHFQAVVTSPPYWGLRRMGDSDHEIGIEPMERYVQNMAELAAQVYHVTDEGATWWLNLGDTFAGSGGAGGDYTKGGRKNQPLWKQGDTHLNGPQQCLIPWRVAIAIQEWTDWHVRKVITWDQAKRRPESLTHVRRPLVQSEQLFMLTKGNQNRWYWDADMDGAEVCKGDVWTISIPRKKRTPGQKHIPPFPEELVRRCLQLSTQPGDRVLDPFAGTGTTLRVADDMGREGYGMDIYDWKAE